MTKISFSFRKIFASPPEEIRSQEQIRKECLRKCGTLLARRDYTCARLRDKLLGSGYDDKTADWALERLREAHYLDDVRFARSFIAAHREDRSRLRIRKDLEDRGVPSEIISEVMREDREETGEEAEIRQILKLIKKRGFDPASADRQESGRMQAYLYRKGYAVSAIRAAISEEMKRGVNTESLDSDGLSV